ncbi:MAG: EAL domain-containing protein [Bosea sp. (in: a-proteobacteria)]
MGESWVKRWRPHLLVAAALALLVLTGQQASIRETLFDNRFDWVKRPATGQIALAEIDARSIRSVGVWPWPRSVHARLIAAAEQAGVSDIVFDVDFSSASSEAEDAALEAALKTAGGSVVLAAFRQRNADRGDGKTLFVNRPLPRFAAHAWLGLVNVLPEPDGIIRRYSHGALIDGEFHASASSLLAGRHAPTAPPFRIDYGIRHESIPSVSVSDILAGDAKALAAIAGRKIIVSGTAAELGDRFIVPGGAILPGSMVQALAAESIMQRRELRMTSHALSLGGLAAVFGAMILAWRRSRALTRVAALVGAGFAIEIGAMTAQWLRPVAIDTSLILAGVAVYVVAIAADELNLRGLLKGIAERRFQRVAVSLRDGLACTDAAGRITLWNPGATAIFGYGEADVLGLPFETLLAQDAQADTGFALTSAPVEQLKTGGGLIVELSGRRRNGEVFDLECSLSAWDAGDELQYGVILRDISQRKRQQERIRFLAEHDTLTGLPNRNSLIARIETAMQQPEWSRARTALITLSVNRFQQLSDLHGHVFGDHMLLAVAARITELTDGSVMLARLGADEFAILAGTLLEDEADALAARVVTAFQDTPLVVDGRRQRAPLFAGLAMARDAADAEELLGNAHFALAESKSRDLAAPSRYQRRMRLALERRHGLEAELREALARGQFELFYQPQLDLTTGALSGAEALVRWRHPQRGYVSPGEFMPVVNTTSLAEPAASWIMETACRQAAAWQRQGHAVRVGVNLTQAQFVAGNLAAEIAALLAATALPPSLLELEVTEDIILDDIDKTQATLAAIRDLGVRIAFDDFGTGYGSLTYLKAFPLDKIKIDQSFVRHLEPGSPDAAIVASTISLGHALGLSVIAEGIETEHAADILRGMGCKEGQGYLFARPLPAPEFESKFLAASSGARKVA